MNKALVLTGTAGVIGCFRSRAILDQWMRVNDYVKIPEGVKVNGIPSRAFLVIPNIENPTPAQALVVHTWVDMHNSIKDVRKPKHSGIGIKMLQVNPCVELPLEESEVPEHVPCEAQEVDQGQEIPCSED